MSDMDDWQAWQHADEQARLRSVLEALERAKQSGTPHETVLLLADECGVGDLYRKHH